MFRWGESVWAIQVCGLMSSDLQGLMHVGSALERFSGKAISDCAVRLTARSVFLESGKAPFCFALETLRVNSAFKVNKVDSLMVLEFLKQPVSVLLLGQSRF